MTGTPPTAIGLYSIGIRHIELEDLLALATAHQLPFLHLRGGPRGFDVARRDIATLSRWARRCRMGVPITMVTADLDLADFVRPGTETYQQASAELDRLGRAAAVLGARAVRLLARRVLDEWQWSDLAVPDLAAPYGLTTLVELHDPAWFTADALTSAAAHLKRTSGLEVLMDTDQVHRAWLCSAIPDALAGNLSQLVPHTGAVHVSDNGDGLTGAGHRIVARTFGALSHDRSVEIAFEWTGADRDQQSCLVRYRRAAAWWRSGLEDRP
ncbi:hypothetical protein Ga0074812_14325 [Parafrankia irregularis]|uniref:Xylose isomerase-like TIM barrel n=1 Tax=Parafrankia irregularis TaxID=795642 RepID=A0A0S4QY93_9ACTN|nr:MULTISPECIES: hypothetical protein [Frankiaceae]KPM53148.1 hypothetical protein ACG83_27700 [Frankia sp. R43]MBE3204670.1 AP endonuclease [Parafrankia sp. CH37]CUU60608.1 hypothetical protein Ga0074812_14325 [Parafrankia irregularis]